MNVFQKQSRNAIIIIQLELVQLFTNGPILQALTVNMGPAQQGSPAKPQPDLAVWQLVAARYNREHAALEQVNRSCSAHKEIDGALDELRDSPIRGQIKKLA